jgi:hypothetical protein
LPILQSDTIVKFAERPIHTSIASLVPDLVVGAVDGPPEYTFSGIVDVLPLADGSILVFEFPFPGQPSLRQYGPEGRYMRAFGRPGQGPGEFRAPTGLAQLPDGRILLGDSQNGRINVYTPEGTAADSWRLIGYPAIIRGREWLTVDTAGTVYLKFRLPTPRSPTIGSVETAFLRLHGDGTIIDTVFPPKLPDRSLASFSVVSSSGGRSSRVTRAVPYSPVSWSTLSPLGYFVTGVAMRYAIDLRIPPVGQPAGRGAPALWQEGDAVLSIRRQVPPVRVSARERADQRAFLEDRVRQQTGRLEGTIPEVPSEKPYFKHIVTGEDGRIWVSISTASDRFDAPARPSPTGEPIPQINWREPTVFDVFEPDGRYLGQVGVPYGTRLHRMRGDTAWGVVRDELDVEVIKRFQIRWP